MRRKRVTSELRDSYFRLMTIKHSISKIQWAIVWVLNYYIIELSWVPKQLPVEFQTARDQMWSGKPHPTEGALGNPWLSGPHGPGWASGYQERHNVTVITVGSKYKVYVRSPAPSHMQPLSNPFQTLQIKWEVKYNCKEASCVFIMRPLFVRLSFIMRLLSLRRYVSSIYMYATRLASSPAVLLETM